MNLINFDMSLIIDQWKENCANGHDYKVTIMSSLTYDSHFLHITCSVLSKWTG